MRCLAVSWAGIQKVGLLRNVFAKKSLRSSILYLRPSCLGLVRRHETPRCKRVTCDLVNPPVLPFAFFFPEVTSFSVLVEINGWFSSAERPFLTSLAGRDVHIRCWRRFFFSLKSNVRLRSNTRIKNGELQTRVTRCACFRTHLAMFPCVAGHSHLWK
jgi:hypothetical protein